MRAAAFEGQKALGEAQIKSSAVGSFASLVLVQENLLEILVRLSSKYGGAQSVPSFYLFFFCWHLAGFMTSVSAKWLRLQPFVVLISTIQVWDPYL